MPDHANRAVRRAPVLVAVVGALVVGGLVDRAGSGHVNPAVVAESVQPVPVAAPADAYSSSWFCAGGGELSPRRPTGQVLVVNTGSAPVTGTVKTIGSWGTSATRSITVAPGSLASVPEDVPRGSTFTGAIVDLDAGSAAVSQVVDGPAGRLASPCATSGSRRWYLPAGQTRVNASDTILLLNPYPTDSIVDLSFVTDQGAEQPQDFQGIDVPPGGLVPVPLGSHLRRRASIATTVTARTGNVVAWALQVVTAPPKGAPIVGTAAANSPLADPALPTPGETLTLGAPSAGTTWVWPSGLAGGGIDERYVIYNPGTATAQVRLSFGLPHGTAEPLDLTVGAGQIVQMVSEQQPRIPAGMAHTATLASTNGVPVVATRIVTARDAAAPGLGTWTGLGQMVGERLAASRWLVAAPTPDAAHLTSLVVANPGRAPLQVAVQGLPGGDQSLEVPAGGQQALTLPTGLSGPLQVSAGAPVYVELDVYGQKHTAGLSFSSAVPLS